MNTAASAGVSSPTTPQDSIPARCITRDSAGVTGKPTAHRAVSEFLRRSLTDAADAALERDIAWFGQLMQQSMARYERTGCFAARGDADRWRLEMESAIKRRSAAQVARMEQERGLA